MKMKAPRRTPTTVSGPGGQPGVDLGAQLGDPPGDGGGGDQLCGAACPHGARPACRVNVNADPASDGNLAGNLAPGTLSLTLTRGSPHDDETTLGGLPLALLAACAGKGKNDVAVGPPAAPVEQIEMDPIKIAAVKGPDGVHLETYDVTELFERAGAALSDKRFDDAVARLRSAAEGVSTTRATPRPALYNAGLAYEGKKDWQTAVARFKKLATEHADSSDAKDAPVPDGRLLRRDGQLAGLGDDVRRDPRAQGPERRRQDRGDGPARIRPVPAQGPGHRRADVLSRRSTTSTASRSEERLDTDFYLGLVRYHLGEIPHERFRAVPLRLPEKQMAIDMDDKARLLLAAQRQYIETIKLGNPQWASASGYQIGSLYEEFYDAFIHAPIPTELMGEANQEKREVYYEELRKKIRILLEKSMRTHEQNLLMMERLGVQNEWRDKSKLAFAKLQKLLDPSYKFEFADPATAGSAAPPPRRPRAPTPTPPAGRAGTPDRGPVDPGSEGPGASPATGPSRQIL